MSGLKKEDLIVLNRNGEQLKNVIRHLIKEFPQSACSISGMSKWLGINRSNSQRVLNAVNKSHNGSDVICMLPGVAGVTEFIEKCKKKQLSSVHIKEGIKALETFQNNIQKYSRSHSELKRLLQNTSAHDTTDYSTVSTEQKRQRHYQAISDLIGESTDFLFSAHILQVHPKNSKYLQEVALISKHNVFRTNTARPFFQYYSHINEPDFKEPELLKFDDQIDCENFTVGIVEDFSSPALVEGFSGYSEKHSCLVFNNLSSKESPFNATFLFNNPDEINNPLTSDTKSSATGIAIKNPTKRLVMMVFMERKLDIRSTVNVGCYSANPISESDLSLNDIWEDRFPEFPELKIINQDSPIANESNGFKYGHLTDYMFKYAGLDKKDFVCYLMEVSYPIWSACYRIYFEHS
ncbi:hypothetical protein [Aliikangiella sp. IMCC44359]|uniref:hypothetical protein n=1 Tax=Aliikangiella sp. IMCC44359 TaxID=3459125 RepID=UPI00403A7D66